MWGSIDFQTNLSIGIMAFIVVIGLYLIFFGREERLITKIKTVKQQIEPKRITKGNYQKIMNSMSKDEKLIFGIIIDSEGSVFQSDLVEKAGFPNFSMI